MKQVILLVMLAALASARQFQFLNRSSREVWIGCLGNPGHPNLGSGGWKLGAGKKVTVNAPDDWRGRFWARTGCNSKTGQCKTGHCGNKVKCNGAGGEPPVTLAEFTLKGHGGKDFYDVSLVDGFNIKMAIEPLGGQSDGTKYSCKRCRCNHNINSECPKKLQKRSSSGHVVACNSACNAFHTDQFCCAGRHDRPETCRSKDWPVNYPKFFKDRCPDAYSYAYDDHKSTFTCNAPAYLITVG